MTTNIANNVVKLARTLTITAICSLPFTAQAGGSLDISLSDTSARVGWDATRMDTGLHLNAALLHESDDGDMVSGLSLIHI